MQKNGADFFNKLSEGGKRMKKTMDGHAALIKENCKDGMIGWVWLSFMKVWVPHCWGPDGRSAIGRQFDLKEKENGSGRDV